MVYPKSFLAKASLWSLLALLLGVIWSSCEKEKLYTEHNLLEYGLPITIYGPENVTVKKGVMSFMEELDVQGEDWYHVVITMDDAMSADLTKLKEDRLKAVKSHRYFFRIVEEDENGYIFENRIDSVNTSFGFNYLMIKGDKEYVIKTPRIGIFSLENVQRMYEAIRSGEEE